jgi:26S proteasome regulatory subunit N7
MGSDPQYAKFPNLSLSQDIFNLSNPVCSQAARQGSLKKLKSAISEHRMAPLYRHLAHPVEGILNGGGGNSSGDGSQLAPAPTTSSTATTKSSSPTLVNSSLLAGRKVPHHLDLGWDEKLYDSLVEDNKQELDALQKEEDEAAEAAGETEVQAARGKRAEFWARVGDKVGIDLEIVPLGWVQILI